MAERIVRLFEGLLTQYYIIFNGLLNFMKAISHLQSLFGTVALLLVDIAWSDSFICKYAGTEIVFSKVFMKSEFHENVSTLSPVHTKHDNDKDNYNDNYICVHTSERYRLFILSARESAALNSRAHYSRMDSDWLSVFLSFISWK